MTVANRSPAPTVQNLPDNRSSMSLISRSATPTTLFGGFGPREHRREYGDMMVQLFRDRMRRDGGGSGILKVWLVVVVDLVSSALNEHGSGGSVTTRGWAGNGSTGRMVVWATMLFFGYRILGEFVAGPVSHIEIGGDCCWATAVLWATSNLSYLVP